MSVRSRARHWGCVIGARRGAVVSFGYASAKRGRVTVRWYGRSGSSRRAHVVLGVGCTGNSKESSSSCRDASWFGSGVTGFESLGTGRSRISSTSRARRWGCVCGVRRGAVIPCGEASAKRIRGSARWYGSGGCSRLTHKPLGHALCHKESSSSRRDAGGCGCGEAGFNSLGTGCSRVRSTRRARRDDCVCTAGVARGAVISRVDAFAIRTAARVIRCASGGSSRGARGTTRRCTATSWVKRVRCTRDSQGGIHVGQGQNHPQGDAGGDALLGRLLHDDVSSIKSRSRAAPEACVRACFVPRSACFVPRSARCNLTIVRTIVSYNDLPRASFPAARASQPDYRWLRLRSSNYSSRPYLGVRGRRRAILRLLVCRYAQRRRPSRARVHQWRA